MDIDMSRFCCPFCRSTNLSKGVWNLDCGEVDALECLDCYAGAPVDAWIESSINFSIDTREEYEAALHKVKKLMGDQDVSHQLFTLVTAIEAYENRNFNLEEAPNA